MTERADSSREVSTEKTIAIKDGWALRYWVRELGVTEKDLRDSVEAVGPRVDDVRKILSRR